MLPAQLGDVDSVFESLLESFLLSLEEGALLELPALLASDFPRESVA